MALIAWSNTAKYRKSGSPGVGLDKSKEEERYLFRSLKAETHLSSHLKVVLFFRSWKKGWHLSADLEMNLIKAAVILVNRWTSLWVRGAFNSWMTLIWSGFTSIPLCDTMKPRNFPEPTPNTHLEAFNHSLCSLNTRIVSVKSFKWFWDNLLFTTMSSMYISIVFPIWSLNILVTIRWYVASAFFRPNGITL